MGEALTELSLSRQNLEPHASRFHQETMWWLLRREQEEQKTVRALYDMSNRPKIQSKSWENSVLI